MNLNLKKIVAEENQAKIMAKKKYIIALGIIALLIVVIVGLIFLIPKDKIVPANKALISLPVPAKINAGQKITVPIIIDTKGDNINAAEVYINFDPRLIRVDEITKDGSFFKIWIGDEPKYSNEKGEISFAGGLPKPGFTGKGQIGTITVTALKNQDAQLVFTPKTRILKNDGNATYVPLTIDPVNIKVQ